MTRAVLSLGSNLGDREAHLRGAVAGLGEAVLMVSGVYETPPWGDPDQPHYLNAVVLAADPAAGPRDWLATARRLERAAGRVRDPERRFGPRTLDVDVVAVWDDDGQPVTAGDPELTLPHPRAHLRAFVLRPWLDIQPYGQLPGHGWLNDLLRVDPVAGDLADLRPRVDIHLES
ncbi:2-amino-4-hydroxy-6-hydroxymethyldihydropteridine diphosphokinase [Dactylosporangium roseum]|uniref:2-amino-4-hydroxy-6-hydroxymethyldihydropteridine diphosphokinase n=1 Tax=Dactylosporangium roseum TaxID=47989 RepID=A0ABY5Z5D3_9ACTN|nr:2-amino-4-hydroxy-6-hydroxymethyldihydropteridine diphosphokinase [Dactylosporangium roseum]UWZ37226.1 2-amino-4-hydroxy-6-hydroxymethyldihydropteridine diphosphokinase [Dactylosporangium roseum]